ncbi:MAG: uroporphyrinogen-III C-methyltransferase [Bacteroidetes bacterium]|nr:uroporphyrinogen-III C-methyltransferase [Bacteroidota bacterium]
MKNPKLTLVGAGPGDPELITLKGIKALEAADVVLYDALANDDLLAFAQNAKVVEYVGKRQGHHSLKQEVINETIVGYAWEFGHVVRLKGGDPFVFGRGFEELEFAAQFGIETTVVPGVSSATSLLGLLQIPITHRCVSRSFHVFSATTKDGELNEEILDSVYLSGTRVVLMGLHQLGKIAAHYQQNGLAKLPAVVIQNGSLENQKTAFGTMETIVEEVKKNQVQTPAIIVIGEVVNLKNRIPNGAEKLLVSDFS